MQKNVGAKKHLNGLKVSKYLQAALFTYFPNSCISDLQIPEIPVIGATFQKKIIGGHLFAIRDKCIFLWLVKSHGELLALIVLVGESQPLVKRDSAITILIDGLELVGCVALVWFSKFSFVFVISVSFIINFVSVTTCHQSKPNFCGRAFAAAIMLPNSSSDTWGPGLAREGMLTGDGGSMVTAIPDRRNHSPQRQRPWGQNINRKQEKAAPCCSLPNMWKTPLLQAFD